MWSAVCELTKTQLTFFNMLDEVCREREREREREIKQVIVHTVVKILLQLFHGRDQIQQARTDSHNHLEFWALTEVTFPLAPKPPCDAVTPSIEMLVTEPGVTVPLSGRRRRSPTNM